MHIIGRRITRLLLIAAVLLLVRVQAEKHAASVASMSIHEIEVQLQVPSPSIEFGALNMPIRLTTAAMPIGTRSQRLQASHQPPNLKLDLPNIRGPISWKPSTQRPSGDTLYLRASQLPARTMSAQHRPLLSLRHGGLCSWRITRRYAVPPPA